jgi:flavorubredoxin
MGKVMDTKDAIFLLKSNRNFRIEDSYRWKDSGFTLVHTKKILFP